MRKKYIVILSILICLLLLIICIINKSSKEIHDNSENTINTDEGIVLPADMWE